MPDPVDIGYAFGLPPRRAIAYFKSKGYQISWNWWETWQAAHAKSFTVAKAARLDILTDIRSEVQRALDEGITAREFADALEPRLKAKGWWGRQVIVDPAGGADLVQLGSPHRLKTIYRTNLKTARAVAQQQVQRATADKRPYWMYDAMDDARTRPEHAALDGMVFRHDDPFWDTHYPPNGFNCRCRVRAFTADEIEERGLVISSSEGKLHQVTQRVGLDKRTGEIVERPATEFRSGRGPTAIRMTPDPGWNYNPGAGGPDVGELPPISLPPDPKLNPTDWRGMNLPPYIPASSGSPAVRKDIGRAEYLAALSAAGVEPLVVTRPDGVMDTMFRRVRRPEGLEDSVIGERFVDHVVDHPDDRRRADFAEFVIPALRDPGEVWGQWKEIHGRNTWHEISLAVFPAANIMVVLREDPKFGMLTWTTRSIGQRRGEEKINKQRRGRLLYRKPEPGK